jgi:hypothetical protein
MEARLPDAHAFRVTGWATRALRGGVEIRAQQSAAPRSVEERPFRAVKTCSQNPFLAPQVR